MSNLVLNGGVSLAQIGISTVLDSQPTFIDYLSNFGLSVRLTGTFNYDPQGHVSSGIITGMTVGVSFSRLITWTDLHFSAVQFFDLTQAPLLDLEELQRRMLSGDDTVSAGTNSNAAVLFGGAGNDVMIGSGGNDAFFGGTGHDVYDGGLGTDAVSFALADVPGHGVTVDLRLATHQIIDDSYGNTETALNVENVEGSAQRDSINGNALANTLWGGNGNDMLNGRGGNDWLDGGRGGDRLYGDDGTDVISGGGGRDTMDGGAGTDILILWTSDLLVSGAEVDLRLTTGNIINDGFGNTETAQNVEIWEGTALADLMHGRDIRAGAPDELRGLDGDDTLIAGNADAFLWGFAGNDSLIGGSGRDTLAGGLDQDIYDGGKGVDLLDLTRDGTPGHGVTLDMGAAMQMVDDGFGNEESVTGIENFALTAYADSVIGTGSANQIIGNDGNDTINGAKGNDTLIGGAGDDSLTGAQGGDAFQFRGTLAFAGVDTITDMASGSDRIGIEGVWIGEAAGALSQNQFRSGAGVTTANTLDQRVIYNTTTGDLYIDADGKGGVAAVKIAVLDNHAAVVWSDFDILA